MGIDELGQAATAQKDTTPLSKRSPAWWIFLMPGKVILWLGYMFPNSLVGSFAGARQRNVPLIQFWYTLVFYVVVVFVGLALYSMSGHGRREKLISVLTGKPVSIDEPVVPHSTVTNTPTRVQRTPEPEPSEAGASAQSAPVAAEVEDPMKKEINARLTKGYQDCMAQALSTPDMLECLSAETKIQDVALNGTYKRLMGKLEPEGQATVRQAQRDWIKERDEHCDAAAAEYENGSMGPVAHASCYLMKEVERTIQLEMLEPR